VAYDLLRGAGQDPDAITGADVTAAALEGDPASCELVAEMGRWFGIGLANLAAALDPGTFVVGGGLGAAGELLLGPARAALAATLTGRGHRPVPVVTGAALGAEAGLVGMADLARGAAA
jgi:glucokinase